MTDIQLNKRILVTGASRGIGAACAKRLAASGFDVTIHCRSQIEQAESVADEIRAAGGSASVISFDVSDRDQARALLEKEIEERGAYYGVVCNAGIAKDNAFPAMQAEEWDAVVHTNLDAFYNVLHPLVMPMIKLRQGGRIVTLSSVSGLAGNRGQTNYSASKAGIIGATKALAIELAKRKITVNCVAPGVIETEMIDGVFAEEAKKLIPMQRFGKSEDVAEAVNFLVSDSAAYITKQVISVNGGMY